MITRKEFLRSMLGLGAGAAGVAMLASCGDDGGSAVDAAANVCTNPAVQIGANHSHTLVVPLADVDAGMAKTYDITGGADHAHSVMITATQFTQIKNGQTLNLTSTSGNAHTHNIVVMCVS